MTLSAGAGCDEDESSPLDAGHIVDAGGDALIDAGALSCQEADQWYGEALAGDSVLRELSACTVDADCASWQPRLDCAPKYLAILSCTQGTRRGTEEAAVARDRQLGAPICAAVESRCSVGVLCPSDRVPRCENGSCTMRYEPDAGP